MNLRPGWKRNMEHAKIAQGAARMFVSGAASLVAMAVINPRVVPGAVRWAVRTTFRAWRDGIREERAEQRRSAA